VCAVSDVPPDGVLAVAAGGRKVLLCRAQGRFFAFAERCTHAAWCLADSTLHGWEIVCSLHGGRFDLRTGFATGRPATKPLLVFPVRTVAERIEVQVPPPPR
jgi:3-phenylpropionate/trans-cinnamate dioxygenase ferredoxin subunit